MVTMKPYRRAPIEELGEEAVEYEPSDQGDIVYQLGDKIRSQAKRLSSLEQYKLLCEKRILELSPGHDLPVRPEHLGVQSSDLLRQQLHQAMQHIARLEQTFAGTAPQTSNEHWLSQKQQLEESLRQEVLNSEKQRAYIETLKQALEAKMEGLGVITTPTKSSLTPTNAKIQVSSVEQFAQLSQRHEQTDSIRREAERYKSVVKDQEAVLRQREMDLSDIRKSASALRVELEDTRQRLLQAEDEGKKLEIEKNTLMDFVQEQQQKESNLQTSLQTMKVELRAASAQTASLTEQLQETKAALTSSISRCKQQEEQLQRLVADNTQTQITYTQVKTALESTQSKTKEMTTRNQSLQEQLTASQTHNESLQMELNTVSEQLKDAKQVRDQLRLDLDSTSKQCAYLQDALRSTKDALVSKETSELRLKAELKELQRTYQNLRLESEDRDKSTHSRMQELNKALDDTEQQLADLRTRHEQQINEMSSQEREIKEIHRQDLDKLEGHISAVTNELKISRNDAANRIKSLEMEIQRLNKNIKELQENLRMANSAKEQEEADHRQTLLKLSICSEDKVNLERDMQFLKEDFNASKLLTSKQTQNIRNLQEEDTRSALKIENSEREIGRLQALLTAANAENENLKGNLEAMQRDLETISDNITRNASEMVNSQELLAAARMREQDCSEELVRLQTFVKGKIGQMRFLRSLVSEKPAMQLLSDVFTAIDAIERDFDLSRKESESLRVTISNLSQELSSTKATISSLMKSEEILRDENSHLAHELDLTRSQWDERHMETSDHIHRVTGELEDTQKDNQGLRNEVKDLREQVQSMEEEINRFREINARLQFQLKSSEERIVDAQRDKRSIEILMSKIINAIPSARLKSIALDITQAKAEMMTLEKAHSQARARVLDLEGELSYTQSPRNSGNLHRAMQSEKDSLELTESSLGDIRRRMQSLELALQEIEASERRKFDEVENYERTISDLQNRLDRKSVELAETQYSLLRGSKSPSRSPSPYKGGNYEVRAMTQTTVQDRLEQARATINQLKRLSRSAIS